MKHKKSNNKRPGLDPITEWVTVTPELANQWLSKGGIENRPISAATVDQYASEMASGNWMPIHQGIALDAKERVIDGQHRLAAIVQVGTPQRFLVTRGIPTTAFAVFDSGKRRNLTDALLATGRGRQSKNVVASARAAVALSPGTSNGTLSRRQWIEVLDELLPAAKFAQEALPQSTCIGLRASSRAVFVRAYYTVDHEMLRAFGQDLRAGYSARTPAITLLGRTLAAMSNAGSSYGPDKTRYRKTERALRAYIAQDQIERLYESPTELFPFPWETTN